MLIRIANTIYNEPWLILPEVHKVIRDQFLGYNKQGINPLVEPDEQKQTAPEPFQMVSDNIACICIDGILGRHLSLMESLCGGVDTLNVAYQLKAAAASEKVQKILLHINSPGGTVGGIPELANLVAEINKTKQVISFSDGQMCSAAYWLGSQASGVFCTPSADVGSIGVYLYHEDWSNAYLKAGVHPQFIQAGKYKTMGNEIQPLSEEDKAMLKAEVEGIKTQFTSAILSKREVDPSYMEGLVYDGKQALEANLVDGIVQDREELISILAKS